MNQRITAFFVVICCVSALAVGTTTAGASAGPARESVTAADDVLVPDADGGNDGFSEPAGAGAPSNLASVGQWSITTTDANGHAVGLGQLPDESGTAQTAMAAASSWWDGQCGSNSSTADKFDVVKQYNRPKVHSRMSGSKAKMYCGKNVSTQSEAQFGLRHIRTSHKSQFASLAVLEGRDWGNFMHWSVTWVISQPGWRTVQNADRYCYQKLFQFHNPSGSTFDRQVVVILGRTGVRIMTAFPSTNADYCQGTRI